MFQQEAEQAMTVVANLCFAGAIFNRRAVGWFVVRKYKDSSVAHWKDFSVALCLSLPPPPR